MKLVPRLACIALGALFVYAGAMKLVDVPGFIEEIGNYRLFAQLAPLLGTTLPTIEIVTGLMLAVGPAAWRLSAALLTLGLLVVFTIAVSAAWLRGIDVRCGCFGTGGGPVGLSTILRDVALLAWSTAVLVVERRHT